MEKAKVFISSILNAAVEDLHAERNIVRDVIKTYPFLNPWAFEKAPASFEDLDESYLRNVDECDVFVVIVGTEPSNPVAAEVQRAKQLNKPILAFAKLVQNRKPMAQMLLDGTGTKYANFDAPTILCHAVKEAIDHTLVMGLRSLASRGRSSTGMLRQFAREKTQVHINPVIPRFCERDIFRLQDFNQDTTTIEKLSTLETFEIPTSRISDVLVYGGEPTLLVDGRIQWISTIDRWRFYLDKPDPSTPLGFSKPSSLNDPKAIQLCNELRRKGYEPGWADEQEIPGRQNAEFQVVYDDDGRYFRIADPVRDVALIVQRR